MKPITIKDIARELSLSISTVSRALQNHPDISVETKRVVVAYAREHHYRPNQLASSLRTQKNTTIGVMLPDITKWFFSTLLAGVEKAANEAGYNVLIARTHDDPERESQCLRMLYSSRVAGIIACPTKRTTDFSAYADMLDAGVPLVLVDRKSPLNCDQVVSDDFGGAFRAVEYLVQTGCRNIHFFSTPLTPVTSERQRGWQTALEHYCRSGEENMIHLCDSHEAVVREASVLLGHPDSPDAIFCATDWIADEIIYVAKMKNVHIPDELAVCGFSNDVLTAHTDPMQTTVEQYGLEMGCKAIERLLLRIDGNVREQHFETITLPTDLIVRETTK